MDKQVYRVALRKFGQRKYVGVNATSLQNAVNAAKKEYPEWDFLNVAIEADRPVDIEGK